MGRLVADPELRMTTTGKEVTAFRIAVDRPLTKDKIAKEADFFTVVAWGKNAVFVNKYFKKGSPIAIHGRLQSRSYEDRGGEKKTAVEIIAHEVKFAGSKTDETAPAAPYNPPADSTGSYTPTYTNTTSSDFEEIEDDYDTPF